MIPVFRPHIDTDTVKAAVDALHLGWLGMGSFVRDFEAELAKVLEVPDDRAVVAVNTCTSALHLALLSLGVGPGDEVITPSLNNIGDFQAIGMCGARPVFADIREEDLALDPTKLASAIGPRTKAIIPLHYMGVPCQIDAIYDVARSHGIGVVEDAAHATGTRVRGRPIGSFGDLVCFSFDAIKTVTCIDGGAVLLPKEKAQELYPRRLLGMTQSNDRLYSNARAYEFDVYEQGFRYHLANLHAAIGLSQLRALPTFIENRRRYGRLYNEALADVPGLVVPQTNFDDVSLFHYVVRVTGGRRNEFREHLRNRGVDTGMHWLPGHWFTWLKNCRGASDLPVTDQVGSEIVTLPLWSSMDERTLETVIGAVRSFGARGKVCVATNALRGVELLRAVKTGRLGDASELRVQGREDVVLRPINTRAPRASDVEALSTWRNQHVKSFLTEFDATTARTRRWLETSVCNDDSRVLFMIEDSKSRALLGYIGIAFIDWKRETAEADSVVRGDERRPGLMTAALRTLIDWAGRDLGLVSFSVRVLADNPAIRFYEKFGFQEVRRAPVVSERTPHGISWREAAEPSARAERELVYMTLAERTSLVANAQGGVS
jgi:dTDP-4-amino-4,6-dideoxygalactose transaminase/RimJ/RimL family protein N-acetyltransferase